MESDLVDLITEIVSPSNANGRSATKKLLVVLIIGLLVQIFLQFQGYHVERNSREYETLSNLLEAASRVVSALNYEKNGYVKPGVGENSANVAMKEFDSLYWGRYGLMKEPRVEACFSALRWELISALQGFVTPAYNGNVEIHLQSLLAETGHVIQEIHDSNKLLFVRYFSLDSRAVHYCSIEPRPGGPATAEP